MVACLRDYLGCYSVFVAFITLLSRVAWLDMLFFHWIFITNQSNTFAWPEKKNRRNFANLI